MFLGYSPPVKLFKHSLANRKLTGNGSEVFVFDLYYFIFVSRKYMYRYQATTVEASFLDNES